MDTDFSLHLDNVVKDKDTLVDFEGPLSLILMLLQKNKIEIKDLKITEILDQYLDFISKMEKLDLEVTSDFIQMASYLILIKTKELISSSDDEVSELDILIESLEQLKAKSTLTQLKAIIPELSERYKTGSQIYSKPQEILHNNIEYQYNHDPIILLKAISSVLLNNKEQITNVEEIEKAMPKRIIFSVKNKSAQIIKRLKIRDITLEELYQECTSTSEIVATFISILELCSSGNIVASHSKDGHSYDLSLSDGNIDKLMEKIELEYD